MNKTAENRQYDHEYKVQAVKLAKEKNLVICDGMTLYHMPVFKKMKEIVDSGKLGPVKMIQVNFGSCKEYDGI